MLHKVISLLLTAVVCTATSSTSLSPSNNDKSTFEIHRTLQNQHSLYSTAHYNGHRRQLSTSSSSYTLPSSYSSKSSKGGRYYYSSKSSKKRSRRRRKKKYTSSHDGSKYISRGSKDDGIGGGGKYSRSSASLTTSGSSSRDTTTTSEDHYYNNGHQFIYSKSSKKRGKSSKSTSSSYSHFSDSSSSSIDDCLVGNTIANVIVEENGLDILETALELTGLDDTLDNKRGPFTLFGKFSCMICDGCVILSCVQYHMLNIMCVSTRPLIILSHIQQHSTKPGSI